MDYSKEEAPDVRTSTREAHFTIGCLAVAAVCLLVLPVMGGNVWFSWNSTTLIGPATEYMRLPFSVSLQSNFVQGLFGFPIPWNFQLLPQYVLSFHGNRFNPTVFFLTSSLLIYCSSYVFARTFEFPKVQAMWTGVLFILLCMPVYHLPVYTIEFWWDGPHWVPCAYTVPLLQVMIYRCGLGRTMARNLAWSVAFVAVSIWFCAAMGKLALLTLLGLGWFIVIFALFARSKADAAWKVCSVVALLVILVFLGPLDFFRGMAGYSTNSLFFPQLQFNSMTGFLSALHLIFNIEGLQTLEGSPIWLRTVVGYPLIAGTAAGCVCAWWTRRRNPIAWLLALPTLLTFLSCLPSSYGLSVLGGLYPNFILLSVFAAATVLQGSARYATRKELPAAALRSLSRASRSCPPWLQAKLRQLESAWDMRPRWLSPTALLLAAGVAWLGIAIHKDPIETAFLYPPSVPPVLQPVKQALELPDGRRFAGRFLNLAVVDPDKISAAGGNVAAAVITAAPALAAKLGNDLVLSGLLYYDIPYLLDDNRFDSPMSLLFFSYLLGSRNFTSRIDYDIVSRGDPRILGLLGVRYVLSDRPLDAQAFHPAGVFPIPPGEPLRLYTLDDTNLGQWSPVDTEVAANYRDALRRMDDPSFDPRTHAVLFNGLPDAPALVPAASGSIERVPSGLRIRASSAGKSLLVLPVEYSACLRIEPGSPAPPTSLQRADFLLTGVGFQGDVDFTLSYRTGLFENSDCRLRDVRALKTIGLTPADFGDFIRRSFSNPHPFNGQL